MQDMICAFIQLSCMGIRRNFSRGATSKFCLFFSGCWRCNANEHSQNALPFLPHGPVVLNQEAHPPGGRQEISRGTQTLTCSTT